MIHFARSVYSFLVMILLLAACGSPPTPASDAPSTSQEQTTTIAPTGDRESSATVSNERGTLRMAHELYWGGIDSLDPASPVVFFDAIHLLYDTLVIPDANYEPVPALATAWEHNDDATIWTFTLRDDVVFHNGKPFTSADVAYTFRRLGAPESESLLSSIMRIIDSIETPDDHTVVFNLGQPHADLPTLFVALQTGIIPDESEETIGETGIGTGPFKLERLDAEGTTRMVANDDYWRGPPGLAAVELIGMADSNARLQALQAGQLDLVFWPTPQQVEVLRDSPNLVIEQFPAGAWYELAMRTDTPPFDDVRVRQAMRLVMDRQQMIDLIVQGAGTVACDTPVWTGDKYRWDGPCPQDIEQARALLAEAGYPNGLDVTLYTSNSLPVMIPLAEVYQQQAARAGINVTIEQVPPDSYWTETWSVEPFFVGVENQYPADFVINLYYRAESPYNVTHWDNARMEQLIDTARATQDLAERKARYAEVQAFAAEESGLLIPFHQDEIRVQKSSVAGFERISRYDLSWHSITKDEE